MSSSFLQRWKGRRRVGNTKWQVETNKDEERLKWHFSPSSIPLTISYSHVVQLPGAAGQLHFYLCIFHPSAKFWFFFFFFFHLLLMIPSLSGQSRSCARPPAPPTSPERCRPVACSDSPEAHPHCSPPRRRSEKCGEKDWR